jgi:hypothetical protein
MAFVDLADETIVGCDHGSYTYYHEIGHIVFNKSIKGKVFSFWKDTIFVWMILSICFVLPFLNTIFKFLPLSLALLYIGCYFFEEIWCWKYAFFIKKIENV